VVGNYGLAIIFSSKEDPGIADSLGLASWLENHASLTCRVLCMSIDVLSLLNALIWLRCEHC
jgi:hypothetical protein